MEWIKVGIPVLTLGAVVPQVGRVGGDETPSVVGALAERPTRYEGIRLVQAAPPIQFETLYDLYRMTNDPEWVRSLGLDEYRQVQEELERLAKRSRDVWKREGEAAVVTGDQARLTSAALASAKVVDLTGLIKSRLARYPGPQVE